MEQTQSKVAGSSLTEEQQRIDIVYMVTDFIRSFRRMWVYVIILALACGTVFAIRANKSYRAYYTASATFTVNIRQELQEGASSTSNFFDNAAAEQMATTFPHILTSGVLQRKVANELGVATVPGIIRAEVLENTNLLALSVSDVEPERAYTTLQAVINNYPSISEVIVGKVNMKMLDETGIPSVPENPKDLKRDALKGAVLGCAAGLCWVVFVTLVRKTIKREDDCPKYVNQQCLGSIPYVRFKQRSQQVERHLNITDENVNTEFREAIRIIRNKVERSARENSLKTILVTSALAGEGKSTIAVNLAISLAQEGKQVALVDCDLRNPSDNEILKIDAKKGLVDFLKKTAELDECMYSASMIGFHEKIKFIFIPGGEAIADGSNLLGSSRMKRIIEILKERMDYVILDSAPVGILTDASVLAQYADGAVFIVKKDYARADHILNGMEGLAESKTHMIGCVLNGD